MNQDRDEDEATLGDIMVWLTWPVVVVAVVAFVAVFA